FLLQGYSGDRSRKLAGSGEKDRVVGGVRQHGHHCFGQRNSAGRTLETTRATGDLKGHRTLGLQGREIDAVLSVHETDLQQASVLKAKHARAQGTRKIELSRTRASAGRLRKSGDRSHIAKGECSERSVPP